MTYSPDTLSAMDRLQIAPATSDQHRAAQPTAHTRIPLPEDQLCHTCRWGWHFDDEYHPPHDCLGECHRHAPTPFVHDPASGTLPRAAWPMVHGSQGCGDWQTRYL